MEGIYFVGQAGAGKTYCAKYLMDKYNYMPCKFAYGVYSIAEKYFGMKNKDRKLLQLIGTDVARNEIEQNIWITRTYENITIAEKTAKILGKELNLVSDDVRFKNEHELLKQMGWIGIYLNVDENIRLSRLESRDGDAQKETLKHKSELEMEEFKDDLYQLDSNNSLEITYAWLEELLDHARKERNNAT